MNRTRWLEAKWPVSIRTLASRLKTRPFVSDMSDGFILERVRDDFLEGRFFEKVVTDEVVRDPFGNESTFERVVYREVEFSLSHSFPQVELRKFPRNIQAFVSRVAEVTDFSTTFVPLTVDAFAWADRICSIYPKQFRIDQAQVSDLIVDENVTARFILVGKSDVRRSLAKLTSGRMHRVDRLQIKVEVAEELLSLQLASDATVRTADTLQRELLDSIRQALSLARR